MTTKISQINHVMPVAYIGTILAKIDRVQNELDLETFLVMLLTGVRHSEALILAKKTVYSVNGLRYFAALQFVTKATRSVNQKG